MERMVFLTKGREEGRECPAWRGNKDKKSTLELGWPRPDCHSWRWEER